MCVIHCVMRKTVGRLQRKQNLILPKMLSTTGSQGWSKFPEDSKDSGHYRRTAISVNSNWEHTFFLLAGPTSNHLSGLLRVSTARMNHQRETIFENSPNSENRSIKASTYTNEPRKLKLSKKEDSSGQMSENLNDKTEMTVQSVSIKLLRTIHNIGHGHFPAHAYVLR